ncbi:hypothetical protein DAMA08_029110 [Martiniozyma asiatica (nom. inval.)]|nr:hypothetical protein DAMA08_029110 [Martiniozyma asiatica]
MPYLGPKSFHTSPLTSKNLAYLNEVTNKKDITFQLPENVEVFDPIEHKLPNVISLSTVSSANSLRELTNSTYTSMSPRSSSSEQETEKENDIFFTHNDNSEDALTFRYLSDLDDRTIDGDNKTIVVSNKAHEILPFDNNELVKIPTLNTKTNTNASANANANANAKSEDFIPPLLRKKSGALVKSSLKLNSLHRSNSMPNAKSVKFADCLEDVKYFDKSQKPKAVSRLNYFFDSSDESDDSDFEKEMGDNQHWQITKNEYPYNSQCLNFARLTGSKEVILESIRLNGTKNALIGFVFVKNLSFEKRIIVKVTTNNWYSFAEIENTNYISSNHIFNYTKTNPENYDKFSFIIKLDELKQLKRNFNLEFCVQFIANNNSYWDNNNGKNYKISLKKIEAAKEVDHSMLDMGDLNIILKNNNNFVDSFSSPPKRHSLSKPRISKYFNTIKKVKSESSLSDIKNLISAFSTVSTDDEPSSTPINSSLSTTSAIPSPYLSYSDWDNFKVTSIPINSMQNKNSSSVPKNFSDYDQIVKKFCFYGSSSHIPEAYDSVSSICQATYQ